MVRSDFANLNSRLFTQQKIIFTPQSINHIVKVIVKYSRKLYQHKSTRVRNVSTRINTSLTRVNTSLPRVNTNQHESKTRQQESDKSQDESTQVKNCPRRFNMSQHKSDANLTQVNLSQLTFILLLELGINNKLQKHLDAREVFINDLPFLVQCLHSVSDSYLIITYFVSDMPSVFIGTIFVSERECEETLFLALF